MKVLLINGSPHEKGSTYTGLCETAKALNENGIDTEICWVGVKAVRGCVGCGYCRNNGGHCAYNEDCLNEVVDKLDDIDGIVVGSPVHYASASGAITSFLDRLFYAAGSKLAYKPGAAIASCRRGGASATFDQLNKYFTINNMPVVGSSYWNQIHGNSPEETVQDEEGMQTLRNLGRNMAWLLQCIEIGKKNGITIPEKEAKKQTNFIR